MNTKLTIFLTGCLMTFAYQSNAINYYVTMSGAGTQDGMSWINAKPGFALQTTINMAGSGDQVWVAAGVYRPITDHLNNTTPTDPRDRCFFMKAGVKIYGGFPNTGSPVLTDRKPFEYITKLSGDFNADGVLSNNSYSVIYNLNTALTTSAVLDGFMITEGNCSTFEGGGIDNVGCSPTISNCIFIGNTGSKGAAIANTSNSNAKYNKCIIAENISTATGAAFYNVASSVTVSNCLIINNSAATYGAVMQQESGSGYLYYCTIANNTANSGGTIFYVNGNSSGIIVSATNCIISGNVGSEREASAGIINYNFLNYNLTQYYNSVVTSNIYGNPGFIDSSDPDGLDDIYGTADDGFNILQNSAALDRGSAANIPAGITTDLKGQSRTQGLNPDLGAYESSYVNIESEVADKTFNVFPNPTTGICNIDCSDFGNTQIQIEIYNNLGQLLSTQQATSVSNVLPISVADLPKGIYILKITANKKDVFTKKFIKI